MTNKEKEGERVKLKMAEYQSIGEFFDHLMDKYLIEENECYL